MTTTTNDARADFQLTPVIIIRFVIYVLIVPCILFLCAGTLNWVEGWVYTCVAVGVGLGSRVYIITKMPDLAAERAGYNDRGDSKAWDKSLMMLVGVYLPLVIVLVAGLDHRFGWTVSGVIPVWVEVIGFLLLTGGTILGMWAMLSNRFFSAVVRIQTDRDHTVQTGGPYQFIRHPGYLGGILGAIGPALLLGSLWALIPAVIYVITIVFRTSLEDRTLHDELEGYTTYAKHTRYRLIPWIW